MSALPHAQRLTRRRRALLPLALAIAFVASAASWLAGLGLTTPTVAPPSGLTDGLIAEVEALTPTISRSIGSAERHANKPVARVKIAKDLTEQVRISVSWENPNDAAAVLNNPNPQIEVGLYRPVSTLPSGTCSTAGAVAIAETLGGATTFCALRDTGATGSQSVDGEGRLLLGPGILTGYLESSLAGATALPCAPDALAPTAWCQPASTTLVGANQRLLYVVASVTVPGGLPIGLVNSAGTLSLQIRAR